MNEGLRTIHPDGPESHMLAPQRQAQHDIDTGDIDTGQEAERPQAEQGTEPETVNELARRPDPSTTTPPASPRRDLLLERVRHGSRMQWVPAAMLLRTAADAISSGVLAAEDHARLRMRESMHGIREGAAARVRLGTARALSHPDEVTLALQVQR